MTPNFEHDDTFLARWLEGTLTEEERRALEQHPDYPALLRVVQAADRLSPDDPSLEALWAKLQPQLQPKPVLEARPGRRNTWWWAAAASLAVLAVALWLLQRPVATPADETVSTGIGEQKTVSLPDGSRVRLNAVSSIVFPTTGWEQNRTLLLRGEAFFDVKKSTAPFVVEAAGGSVTVLGTTFSIKTRDNTFEVACYTGSVKAISKDAYEITLKPGQQAAARYGIQEWLLSNWRPGAAPAWTQGESRFHDAPLHEVLEEMGRQYDVQLSAPGLENRPYTGGFPHNNLDLALKLVCDPLNLTYTREDRTIVIKPGK